MQVPIWAARFPSDPVDRERNARWREFSVGHNLSIQQHKVTINDDSECVGLVWLDEDGNDCLTPSPCGGGSRRGDKYDQYKRGDCPHEVIITTQLIESKDNENHHIFLQEDKKVWLANELGILNDNYWVKENHPDVIQDGLSITPYGEWETNTLHEVLKFAHDKIKSSEEVVEEDLLPLDPEVEPVITEEEEEEEEEPETTVEEEETIIIYKPPPCGTPMGGPCAEPSKLPFILGLIGLVGVTYIVTKGD